MKNTKKLLPKKLNFEKEYQLTLHIPLSIQNVEIASWLKNISVNKKINLLLINHVGLNCCKFNLAAILEHAELRKPIYTVTVMIQKSEEAGILFA